MFGTSGGAATHYTVSASDYPSFCLVRIHNLLGFPFYTHKGPSGETVSRDHSPSTPTRDPQVRQSVETTPLLHPQGTIR